MRQKQTVGVGRELPEGVEVLVDWRVVGLWREGALYPDEDGILAGKVFITGDLQRVLNMLQFHLDQERAK